MKLARQLDSYVLAPRTLCDIIPYITHSPISARNSTSFTNWQRTITKMNDKQGGVSRGVANEGLAVHNEYEWSIFGKCWANGLSRFSSTVLTLADDSVKISGYLLFTNKRQTIMGDCKRRIVYSLLLWHVCLLSNKMLQRHKLYSLQESRETQRRRPLDAP